MKQVGGGTEDLRIIASISWGCVGDGNGGISQRSSQSNGIYVQHSGLQPGNKCLSPPRSHSLSLSPPTSPLFSLSVCHLCIFNICVFTSPCLCLCAWLSFFLHRLLPLSLPHTALRVLRFAGLNSNDMKVKAAGVYWEEISWK